MFDRYVHKSIFITHYDDNVIFSVILFFSLFTGFTIDDGMLRANTSFDYEGTSSYNITIFASDGKTNVSAQVVVNILPVNEFDPVFAMRKTVYNVTEDGILSICVDVSVLQHND